MKEQFAKAFKDLGIDFCVAASDFDSTPDNSDERITLPQSTTPCGVQRLTPTWDLDPSTKSTFAGIPNKRLLAEPLALAGIPAELAVARVAEIALKADAWWAVWGSETTGVSPRSMQRVPYPDHVRELIKRISGATKELMRFCDDRTASGQAKWRSGKFSKSGGLWDVVVQLPNGNLAFLECKRTGKDSIQDNQRAFLEAALKHIPIERFAIVSWSTRR